MPRRNQQTLCDASELPRVAHELPINENRSAIGSHRKLDLTEDRRHLEARVSHHVHGNGLLFSRPNRDLARKVLVTVLANDNFVLSGQQQDLLRALQLLSIAKILAINPYTRLLYHFR